MIKKPFVHPLRDAFFPPRILASAAPIRGISHLRCGPSGTFYPPTLMCCRWLYKPKLCGFCVACSTSTGITGPQVVEQANVRSTLFPLYPDQVLLQSGLLLGPVPFFITFVPHHEFPFRTLEDYSIHKHLYFWSFTKLWMLFSIPQNGELTLRKFGDSKLPITVWS